MINCYICDNPLIYSGNRKILFCPETTAWIPDLNRHLIYHHSIVSADPQTEDISFKIITNPPYIFEISFKPDLYTIIKKIKFREKTLNSTPVNLTKENVIESLVLQIDTPIILPWNDKEKCLEKAKLYNVFA